ncbi:gamma-glutamyltransferase family protein [Roseateles oligotrophus]|uniref:Gamma-glutamyltransferase family protein n=1 Tax=Roseateles oligotrophus TaxID=1769250 RepID=A0ABT2YGH1_9BURK|nr:gamma-glutamyltransferase family protein [Roseateles oligotrophus]MCV2369161.1 gamma-glutamyltransferase family protein [Roseateles oligotrophus]
MNSLFNARPCWPLPALPALFALWLTACSTPLPQVPATVQVPAASPTAVAASSTIPVQPEGPSGWSQKPGWAAQRFAVAAAHPLAADAGYEMLRAGGSALDAAIATQLVLTLVEPQSSGIAGGAFLMHWDGRQVVALDGRETAPAAADERLFLKPDGQTMNYVQAVVGGRSVGTPGLLRMLEQAHVKYGKLPWARLFEPAIRLSENGFELGSRMHQMLSGDPQIKRDPQAAKYFFDAAGAPLPVGTLLRNPALAEVLRKVAKGGSEAFMRGPVAADIVRRVRGHASNPGLLSEADMAGYSPKWREPMCSDWRETWRVCGFPPPSSGHLAVMQMLGMTAQQSAAQSLDAGLPSAAWLNRYAQAANLAFADRAQFVADPDFVAAPGGDWASLLAPDYLRQRAALIGPRSSGVAKPGQPGLLKTAYAPQAAQPEYGTSHISVVDAEGRAVSMTTTVESVFGSRIMSDGGTGLVGGFLLNNQLTDFALNPRDAAGQPVANRLEPGKRPRSSMAPTLVFDRRDGRLLMSLGSPGGAAIIHYVAKMLIATHDWEMNVQEAISLPNFGAFNGPTLLEPNLFPAGTAAGLRALGHEVVERDLTSGSQAIMRRPAKDGGGWLGGADPRREGVVRGD